MVPGRDSHGSSLGWTGLYRRLDLSWGTIIQDGDLVIADDDGVVIWPQERIGELLIKAEARLQQDHARLAQLLEKK
ncbi:hypothetical protein KSB_35790 [Ktedonobacter robiniae]|uniref:Dimethylmenaquinone methyltransferase n=1 Tax=Ktedonobacter robiniae TaxID=2778365 RepID=A0ABQ3UQW3_9CHLR|nr:hypothetical protein KSB_35790 [Ktedonobacter robiniae]